MKKLLLIIPLALLLLFSCDSTISVNNRGRTILISIAADYTDTNLQVLSNTPNDQAATIGQLVKLAGGNIEVHIFRVDNGKRYYISSSEALNAFEYGEMEDATIGTNATKRIKFKYKDNSSYYSSWDLSTVISMVENINAGKNDLIIFHYSGHGLSKGELITKGEIDSTTKKITNHDIIGANNIIGTLCSSNKDAIKVMLIDSCYSGIYIKNGILSSCDKLSIYDKTELYEGTSLIESLKGSIATAFGKDTYGTPGLYVLSAATSKQLSYDGLKAGNENQMYFGAFSFYLLRAFGYDTSANEPAAISGNITLYGLYKDVVDSFPNSTRKIQTPRATLSPIDIVLF